jgi:hypothetical protein
MLSSGRCARAGCCEPSSGHSYQRASIVNVSTGFCPCYDGHLYDLLSCGLLSDSRVKCLQQAVPVSRCAWAVPLIIHIRISSCRSFASANAMSLLSLCVWVVFLKAVYYAAVSVIGRPAVPFTHNIFLTSVFLTITCLLSATIIPT